MAAVPIVQASRELDISRSQLLRDIAAGAPVVQRGGRGRGRQMLVDVDALAAWRRLRGVPLADDGLRVIAAELPEIIATAMHAAFVATDGPHKRAVAGALAGAWYLVASALLDRLRTDAPELPELTSVPEKITALRVIFAASARIDPSTSKGTR